MTSSEKHVIHLADKEFMEEALSIVNSAVAKNIILRILGAMATYLHSMNDEQSLSAFRSLGRLGEHLFSDLDLMAYSKQRGNIMDFFEKNLRFTPDRMTNAFFGTRRLRYFNTTSKYWVDIFFDKLEFSHNVYFGNSPGKGRLELDTPTISLTDLMLTKLQIHEVNFKDLADICVILLGHDTKSDLNPRELIDAVYIARILADDWGFWYDATQNLKKASEILHEPIVDGKLSGDALQTIQERISKILKVIDAEPKTKNWEKRAKIGTSKMWYQEVEGLEES